MTNLKVFVIANALCVWMSGAAQVGSFEKQALSSAQETHASDLDAGLPVHPFASWFSQIVGPKAGVVWQLTECGAEIAAPGQTGQDLLACAEVNAILPDGRKVFVAIRVGTFKKGLTGKPAFFRAVIEKNEQFYQVPRLSDLPEMLRAPDSLPATKAKNRIINLPAIKADSPRIAAPLRYLAPLSSIVPPVIGGSIRMETPPPAPPRARRSVETAAPVRQSVENVSESVLRDRVITMVKPVYPPSAKQMNATGTVEVQVTISQGGLVIEATAISGHFALRNAAVEAARKWIFKPVIFNGAPTTVKSVLSFVFAPGAR
ncbi:MAG: energy transducer TonB [Blastocatellia bacterium]